MKYPKERKEAILKKMLPPNNQSIKNISLNEGITEVTLYKWRNEARSTGHLLPDGNVTASGWGSADKFAAVIQSAAMNEAERSQFCREQGLYPQHLEAWREACKQANDWDQAQNKKLQESQKRDGQRIRTLEKELRRKEKALAETAALLVLQKKVEAIWGTGEDV